MNRLIKICTAISLTLICCGVFAQSDYKVKDKSSRKAPEWSGGMLQEYIITSATSDDIERAKEMCMDDVRKYIVDAVALNIKTSSESNISEEIVNNKVVGFLDEFNSNFTTQSASIPYMTSISHSKVEDYYWEQRADKKTKKITYYYTIKYPFPSFELLRVVDAFNEQDRLMVDDLVELEEGYLNITSVEEISVAINNLKTLGKYFFDDVRQNRVKALIKNYSDVYGKIAIRRVSDELGSEQYGLMYGDNLVSYSKPPRLSSNTAFELSANKNENVWEVEYNHSTCYKGEINYIDVTWIINGRSIKDRFYIELESESMDLKPIGEVDLSLKKNEDNSVVSVELSLNVESFDNKRYTIQKIQLDCDNFTKTVLFDNIGYVIKQKGVYNIDTEINKGFVLSTKKGRFDALTVKGVVTYIDEDQNIKMQSFLLPLNYN